MLNKFTQVESNEPAEMAVQNDAQTWVRHTVTAIRQINRDHGYKELVP